MIFNNILVFVLLSVSFACSDGSDDTVSGIEGNMISNIYIEKTMMLHENKNVTILGKGFRMGDILVFEAEAGKYDISLSEVEDSYVSFSVPASVVDGLYTIWLKRGERTEKLGTTTLKVSILFNVPDKTGATVKGVVFSGGKPIKGIRVSDGLQTTVTDDDGFYWLNSDKSTQCVFYTIPTGYQPVGGNNVTPGFWAALKQNK